LTNAQIDNCQALQTYKTTNFLNRLCLPTDYEFVETITSKVNTTFFERAMNDMDQVWPTFLIIFVIIFVFILIYFVLLKCFAKCMIWVILLGALAGLVGAGFLAFC